MDITVLLGSFGSAWQEISPLIINLVLALFLLLIGLLIAKGIGLLITLVFKTIRLDKGAKQIGFNQILEKGSIKRTTSELLGDLVYWILAFVVIVGVVGVFGLPVGTALRNVFAYMGVVFLATLILGLGVFLAGMISGIIRVVMANLGLEGAKIVPRIIYYIIVIFAFLAALAELGISTKAFEPHIGVIVGAFGLAAAIAFGLGCKDMAADFLHNLFKGK